MSLGEPTGVNTVIKGLPEPYAKRTVEGDIGMRYSASGVVEAAEMCIRDRPFDVRGQQRI